MADVSIIIPAFKAAEFIGEALASVAAQTFTDNEVIVVNDGSPDTEELEQELNRYSARLRYIKQENRGAAAARNAGLRKAGGEFVAFLDADDTWLPTLLEKQIALLKSSNADLVYADALLFGESPLAGRTFMELGSSRGEVTPENLLAVKVTVLLVGSGSPGCTTRVTKMVVFAPGASGCKKSNALVIAVTPTALGAWSV